MPSKRPGFLALALVLLLALQGAALAQGSFSGGIAAPAQKATSTAYTRMLKLGCRGADVKALQQKLKTLSFYKGTCDSIFGKGTQSAVISFQKAHKLKADGVVGRATHDAIFGITGGTTPPPPPTATASPAATAEATPAPTQTYTLGKLDNQITLRKGSKGSNVKDLQAVLKMKGFYSGAVNGNFQNETKNAVMSFQHSIGIKSDGLAGNYTLSALYTMLNPPDLSTIVPWPAGMDAGFGYTIEKPSWTDASGKLFKRGMQAVVVDVRSGYMFNIKRTGGTKHADVETLTPLDTATFFKCTGNFSWNRRPIWVIVGGHRLAASMNCMPHGYDSIDGNDFRGQFCIHFVGSRTHGTNRVDPDHRKCIEEAYQSGLTMTPPPTASASPAPTDTDAATTAPATSAPLTTVPPSGSETDGQSLPPS